MGFTFSTARIWSSDGGSTAIHYLVRTEQRALWARIRRAMTRFGADGRGFKHGAIALVLSRRDGVRIQASFSKVDSIREGCRKLTL